MQLTILDFYSVNELGNLWRFGKITDTQFIITLERLYERNKADIAILNSRRDTTAYIIDLKGNEKTVEFLREARWNDDNRKIIEEEKKQLEKKFWRERGQIKEEDIERLISLRVDFKFDNDIEIAENRFSYRQGITIEWDYIRELILSFHNYKCYKCGRANSDHINEYGRELEIHHITPVSFNNGFIYRRLTYSFIPLCGTCHPRGAQ